MAASKTIEVRGVSVALYEQSFIVGHSGVAVHVGPHMTENMVRAIVIAVHDGIRNRAVRAAKEELVGQFARHLDGVLK